MKRILIILLTINCSLFTIHCSAQLEGQQLTDSLLKELPKQKEDTVKVLVLCKLSQGHMASNITVGLSYGQQALALAEKLGWERGIYYSENCVGVNYRGKTDYANAHKYLSMSLAGWEKLGDKARIANACKQIGYAYMGQSMNARALEYYFRALKLATEIGNDEMVASILWNIGLVYDPDNYQKTAIDYYFKALKIAEKIGNKQLMAKIYISLASDYQRLGDYAKALDYYSKAIPIQEKLGDKYDLAVIATNMGNLYIDQKNFTMAIESLHKSLQMDDEVGNQRGMAITYAALGHCYLEIARDTTGHTQRSIDILEHTAGKYKATVNIPKTKAAQLQYSVNYCQLGLSMALKMNAPRVAQECYNILISTYELSGEYKKALEASDNYYVVEDSLYSKEKKEEVVKLEMTSAYNLQHLADSLKTEEKEKLASLALNKQKTYTYLGIAGILLLVGFSFFIVKERSKSEMARKQSDGLLLNILPEEVAAELKTTGTTAAKHYDDVTVLFTDFVNFTQAGELMSPQALIDELHTCFKAFDEITHKYNIEKIKTIGDAYLAVCGLPTADPKHAENVVKAAVEINAFMQDRLAKMGSDRTFAVRIGIHSGSVVAGIVGVKKFAYDIWGDTVNTAARMEQNSEAGKINISQTTYDLVKNKFSCEYRGEVEAKGKGVMRMYYVS